MSKALSAFRSCCRDLPKVTPWKFGIVKVVAPSPLPYGKMVTFAVPEELAFWLIVHVVDVHDTIVVEHDPEFGTPEPSMHALVGILVVPENPVSVGELLVRVTLSVIVMPESSVA